MELSSVARYLGAVTDRERRSVIDESGLHPFVTISRQPGAGGHALAEALVAEMAKREDLPVFQGWQIFDQELARRVAQDHKLRVSMKTLLTEAFQSRMEDFLRQVIAGNTPQDTVLYKTFKTIRELACLGKGIFVGRAAACYTRDLPAGIHVRLVAGAETRLDTVMRRWGVERTAAVSRLREEEKARALLVRRHFGRDIDDALLYDAVWNTERIPLPEIAKVLARMVQDRVHRLALSP